MAFTSIINWQLALFSSNNKASNFENFQMLMAVWYPEFKFWLKKYNNTVEGTEALMKKIASDKVVIVENI